MAAQLKQRRAGRAERADKHFSLSADSTISSSFQPRINQTENFHYKNACVIANRWKHVKSKTDEFSIPCYTPHYRHCDSVFFFFFLLTKHFRLCLIFFSLSARFTVAHDTQLYKLERCTKFRLVVGSLFCKFYICLVVVGTFTVHSCALMLTSLPLALWLGLFA